MVIISTLKQKRGFPIPHELGRKHKMPVNVCVVSPGRNQVHPDIHKVIKEDSLYKLFLKEKGFSEESDGKVEKKAESEAKAEAKAQADAKAQAKADAAKVEADKVTALKKDLVTLGVGARTLNGKNSIALQAMLDAELAKPAAPQA